MTERVMPRRLGVHVEAKRGATSLIIEGIDMSNAVLRDGFKVELTDAGPRLTIAIDPEILVLDGDVEVVLAKITAEQDPDG